LSKRILGCATTPSIDVANNMANRTNNFFIRFSLFGNHNALDMKACFLSLGITFYNYLFGKFARVSFGVECNGYRVLLAGQNGLSRIDCLGTTTIGIHIKYEQWLVSGIGKNKVMSNGATILVHHLKVVKRVLKLDVCTLGLYLK
jgi:hypothetical protein